jgi:hypothetical protein
MSLSAMTSQYFTDGMMPESANPLATLRAMTKGRSLQATLTTSGWSYLGRPETFFFIRKEKGN